MLKKTMEIIKNRGMKEDILLSHIIILIVPIVISFIVEFMLLNSISNVTNKFGLSVAENARINIDDLVETARQISLQINGNDGIKPIFDSQITAENSYELKNTIEMLNYTCQNSYDIDNIFVYNINTGLAVSAQGRGQVEDVVGYYYVDTDIDAGIWKSTLEDCISEQFRIVHNAAGDSVRFIEYISPLSGNDIGYINKSEHYFPAAVVIRMNVDKFTLPEGTKTAISGMELYAVTPDGSVVCRGDVSRINSGYILKKMGTRDSATIRRRGKINVCVRSAQNDWLYVAAIPMWEYNKITMLGMIVVVISMAVIFLAGMRLILNFIKNNYGSIINVGNKLVGKVHADENINLNNIDSFFEHYMNDHNMVVNKMEKISDMYQSTSLLRIITESKFEQSDVLRIKEYMNSDKFCVLCCEVEDCSRLYSDTEYASTDKESKEKDAAFIIQNVLSEYIEEEYKVISTYVNKKVVILAGSGGYGHSEFEKEINAIAMQVADSLCDKFMIEAVFSIGKTVNEYSDIVKSYNTALEAIPYTYVLEKGRVAVWERCREMTDVYEITMFQKQQLTANLLAGNKHEVKDVIRQLYERNLKNRNLSVEMVRCFVMELAKLYEDILIQNDIFDERIDVFHDVSGVKRAYMTEKYFEGLTEKMCDRINSQKTDNKERLAEKVMEYIRLDYANTELNVAIIADLLGVSRNYISKVFKEYTGDSILNTIHKVRAEEAVALLKEGKKIGEVAEKVGYINANVFIRSFKKYMGITPGKYLENEE